MLQRLRSVKMSVLAAACGAAFSVLAADNPLLDRTYPFPYDRFRAEQVEPAIGALLEKAEARRRAYVADRSAPTYENTVTALEEMAAELDEAMTLVRHLEGVASTPELRKAVAAVLPKYSAFDSSIMLDQGIYARLKAFAATEEARSLTGARKRFLEEKLAGFRRNGAEATAAQRERLAAISVELSRLRKQFADNVLDATNAFELIIKDETLLAGLPESARRAARDSARQKGVEGWRFTLQAPSYQAVMTYLDDAGIRERVFRANAAVAAGGRYDNVPVMKRILELRRERARILGFKNYADLVADDRMARTGDRVREFLASLESRTRPYYEKENQELIAFRRSLEGPQAPDPAPWDIAYYAEKMRKARYDFDDEALRPYFPMDAVMNGMFEIVHRLYGVNVVKVSGVPVWAPAVEFYELRDADRRLLGFFYTDFFPRENKRAGAWSSGLVTGGPSAGGRRPHVGAIHGNLTPPSGGAPSLLTKREVETIFHEFGHQIHHLLTDVPVRGLSGTVLDFVELPSQIMENWTWERESLDLFARHYQTGAAIPDGLFTKMVRARTYRAAYAQMRQLTYGALDLGLHVDWDESRDGDLLGYARKIFQRFSPFPVPEDFAMVASFSHIFSGMYACGYYSYKWSEVLDADAFSRFQKEGIFNPKTGQAFRKEILEKGSTEPPEALFRNFMGRDPDPEALMRRSGMGRSHL